MVSTKLFDTISYNQIFYFDLLINRIIEYENHNRAF